METAERKLALCVCSSRKRNLLNQRLSEVCQTIYCAFKKKKKRKRYSSLYLTRFCELDQYKTKQGLYLQFFFKQYETKPGRRQFKCTNTKCFTFLLQRLRAPAVFSFFIHFQTLSLTGSSARAETDLFQDRVLYTLRISYERTVHNFVYIKKTRQAQSLLD